jgi:uncharacterized protein (DUF2147 family)
MLRARSVLEGAGGGVPFNLRHRQTRIRNWVPAFAGVTVAFGGLALAASPLPPAETDTGYWLNPEQGWVVESRACPTGICSYLVGFRMVHPHPPGFIPRDERNVDARLRNRPLCGIQLSGGFDPKKKRNNKLEGGWVYDPETGGTYSAVLTLVDTNTVKLRGYVGIPLFGRTVTLNREPDPGQRCAMPTG